MAAISTHEVTQLLLAWGDGDQAALDKLIPLVQGELHRLARNYMKQERAASVMQATALVHEAFLRLIDWNQVQWQNRAHFLGVVAQLMRRTLVDLARNRNRLKRGGQALKVSLGEADAVASARAPDWVALDEALTELASLDERKSRIVELRFFGGLSVEETAEVLIISTRTVMREWSLAQAWLYRELSADPGPAP